MNESSLEALNPRKPILSIRAIVCFYAGTRLYWHACVVFVDNIAGWAAAMGA